MDESERVMRVRKIDAVLERLTDNYETKDSVLFDDLILTIAQAVATSEYYTMVLAYAYETGVIEEDYFECDDA